MKLLLLVLLFLNLYAGEVSIASWNLLHLSNKTIYKKDTQFISRYLKKDYDIFVVEEIHDKEALKKLTNRKVLFSKKTGRRSKEYIAFIVSKKYEKEQLKVFDYYDSHNTFERVPAMLAVGNKFGVIGVHLVFGRKRAHGDGLTKKEVHAISNLLKYFSKKSGLPENKIIIAGDFNLPAYKIRNILSAEQHVLIEKPTTVSTSKKRIAAHDYDHFIVHKKVLVQRAFVDYEVLNCDCSITHRKWFRKKVSDHYPIFAVFAF